MADSIAARVKVSRRKCVNVGKLVSRIRQRSEDSLLKFIRTYQIDRANVLGAGQFGTVYAGTDRKNGRRIAVKVIVKAKLSLKSTFNVGTLRNEFTLLKKLKHPCIVKFEMLSESSKEIFAVMERADGDMLELILSQPNSRLNERSTKFLLRQVLSAIRFLHGRKIAHCDLKPENILLSNNTSKFPHAKLCDFGYAAKFTGTQTHKSLVGTPAYLAPEVTARTGFNKTLDMWSIGVIIYVTLSGSFPFNETEPIIERNIRPEFLFPANPWKEIAPEAVDLIQKLLKMNMEERINAEQCIAHHWLQNALTYADLLCLERRLGVATVQQRFLTSEAEDLHLSDFATDFSQLFTLISSSPYIGFIKFLSHLLSLPIQHFSRGERERMGLETPSNSPQNTPLKMTSIDQNNNFIDTEDDKSCDKDEDTQQEQPQETDDLSDAGGEIVREKGLSFLVVLLEFLKGRVGVGFLALPMAFRHAGPWSGLILLFFIAFLNYYSMSLLVACAQYHYVRLNIPYLSYGNVARETCKVSFRWVQGHGRFAKNIVNIVTLLHQFGVCSVYYLFIASSLEEIFGHMSEDLRSWPWLLLIFLPMVILNSILSVEVLSTLCIIGNVLTLLSLAVILYTLVEESHLRIDGYKLDFMVEDLPSAVGSIMLVCLTQALVLPLENKIKKPRQMLGPFGVLSCGISISVLIYATVGFLGYLAYGENVEPRITKNLPQHQISTTVVKLTLCLSVFASFLLQMYVIIGVLWPRIDGWMLKMSPSFKLCCKLFFRALMVLICFLVAYNVSNKSSVGPLIGATTGTLLAFVFPAMIDLFTFVPLLLKQSHFREED
uniref:Protein kinase domain-containing protein n=1 Tax=Globodera rostochiensis TaxID=31243 RepID=A0A914H2P8_GLORO